MNDYKIYFTTKAYVQLLTEVADYPHVETGGVLVGQRHQNTFYVFETVDPGFKADRKIAEFSRHYEYTEHLAYKVANQYEGNTTVIGYYHRHPGSYDRFSGGDEISNLEFAQTFNGVISGLVNIDPQFRLAFYYIAPSGKQSSAISYIVDDSAFRDIMTFKSPQKVLSQIFNQENSHIIRSNDKQNTISNTGIKSKTKKKKHTFMMFPIRLFNRKASKPSHVNTTETVFELLKDDIDKLSEKYNASVSFKEEFDTSIMTVQINEAKFNAAFKLFKGNLRYAWLKTVKTDIYTCNYVQFLPGCIFKAIDNYFLKRL